MISNPTYNYLLNYVINLQSKGIYTFSKRDLINSFNSSNAAIGMALNRLVKKKRLAIVRKEFYVIIPPEYLESGILPSFLFVDDLMRFLDRKYYVSLLSAAVFHGGTHQQPQDFYVSVLYPNIKKIQSSGICINFIVRPKLFEIGIQQHKTDTGYIKISNAELTALDLIQHCNKIGGLNRAVTVIDEMVENINPDKLRSMAEQVSNVPTLQRLGYVFDKILQISELSGVLKEVLLNKKSYRVLLSPQHPKIKGKIDKDWKVIINTKIESEI